MISLDTNIMLPAIEPNNPLHTKAASFVDALQGRSDVALSEFMLVELYEVLRSPGFGVRPLGPLQATEICTELRRHPRWQIFGAPPDSVAFHDSFWPMLATPAFARRRVYDWRLALSLVQQGVDEFATINTKDFEGFGFRRVWNPLAG